MRSAKFRPGKVDRSPTGTELSARMAVLCARGKRQGDAPQPFPKSRAAAGSPACSNTCSTPGPAARGLSAKRYLGRTLITPNQGLAGPEGRT
ncbi:hypothetical protein STA1M1_31240 [Sinisalibacter aestuarii]|uniref:Uncharacterized protein n=1 Tax=Sinisalibacter aestuarii TaxID=2949426 RepID=A0ABQ5LW84_9RHOB|nr:hypothetical protein STA1M1_31240 [Sinisalibacter aestuarii]